MFVERLWRSVKYEEVYVRAYDSISAARQGVGRYRAFYNQTRPHRGLDGKTPEEVYCDNLTARLTAVSSDLCEAPLKEWNILSNQLGPPLSLSLPPLPRRPLQTSCLKAMAYEFTFMPFEVLSGR